MVFVVYDNDPRLKPFTAEVSRHFRHLGPEVSGTLHDAEADDIRFAEQEVLLRIQSWIGVVSFGELVDDVIEGTVQVSNTQNPKTARDFAEEGLMNYHFHDIHVHHQVGGSPTTAVTRTVYNGMHQTIYNGGWKFILEEDDLMRIKALFQKTAAAIDFADFQVYVITAKHPGLDAFGRKRR